MKVRVFVTEFRAPEGAPPETAQRFGRRVLTQIGEADIEPGNYVQRVQVFAEGVPEHPVADIPFSLGTGHWVWVPPEPIDDDES